MDTYTHVDVNFVICIVRGMRERSPPLPKITHPSFPRLGKSQASTGRSARPQSPPEGTACLITVSPVPGKLACLSRLSAFIPGTCSKCLWVSYTNCNIHDNNFNYTCSTQWWPFLVLPTTKGGPIMHLLKASKIQCRCIVNYSQLT